MKKILLILITLTIASTTLFAETTVDTQLRMASYWAFHEDRDFSYNFDDNDDGDYGFKVTGNIEDHTTVNMSLKSSGEYNAEGGDSDVYVGSIFFQSEIWKDMLAADNAELNDMFSIKLNGGIRDYEAVDSFSFADNVEYGGDGLTQVAIGTEKGLGLGADVIYKTPGFGYVSIGGGFLSDLGDDGFQTVIGGRDTYDVDADEEDLEQDIGIQGSQYYAVLGYDLLGTRENNEIKDLQVFADLVYASNAGISVTPSDFLDDTGDGSVRNGGRAIGLGVRANIPVDLVENDPYTRLTVSGSAAYFSGNKFSEKDLLISEENDTAVKYDPYYTYGADLGWYMPFSAEMVMDVTMGLRGRTAMKYDTDDVKNEVVLQYGNNLDVGGSVMFKFPNIVDGAQAGVVTSIDNMYNGQSLPNVTDDSNIRGFLNQDPNLTAVLAGGVNQEVGNVMFTHQIQAGYTNLLGNDLYVSTSDDHNFVDPEFLGGVGTTMAFDDVSIDMGLLVTPFGGLETSLLGNSTGRDTLDAGTKTGMFVNFTIMF